MDNSNVNKINEYSCHVLVYKNILDKNGYTCIVLMYTQNATDMSWVVESTYKRLAFNFFCGKLKISSTLTYFMYLGSSFKVKFFFVNF